jgi:starch phosphorylase
MIAEWVDFIRRADVRPHVIFLSDYDMRLAEHLVQGVDVWINTPRRPWEACGTSGMKILVNGGLNLSERDGWWAEAYTPEVGWAIGDGEEHPDTDAWDAIEAEQLYALLENEVVPAFYERDANGVPQSWVKRMRESMARLTPRFSATRAVRDYTDRYYLPAFSAYLDRVADDGAEGAGIVAWRARLVAHWDQIRFGERWVEAKDGKNGIMLRLVLGELDPGDVRVELYAEGKPGTPHTVVEMHRWESSTSAAGEFLYGADVSRDRPPSDFTPRVRPWREGVAVPLEESRILWFS